VPTREITVPPDLAPPPPPPLPTPTATADDDLENDRTVVASPRLPRAVWFLVTPSGAREPIAGTVVVGRQPAKTAFKGSDRSLILTDSSGQVSKSHAVFQVDAEGLWVSDLGSTNGVVVITPGGQETVADGGTRVAVPAGSEVELGAYVVKVEHQG
jgi:hypothetical protein